MGTSQEPAEKVRCASCYETIVVPLDHLSRQRDPYLCPFCLADEPTATFEHAQRRLDMDANGVPQKRTMYGD